MFSQCGLEWALLLADKEAILVLVSSGFLRSCDDM